MKAIQQALGRIDRLTNTDKANISRLAKQHGISFNKQCPDCWKDTLIALAAMLGVKVSAPLTASGNYRMVGKPTTWMPYHIVLDAETSDEVIERFINEFPNQHIYERIKN